MTPLLSHVLKRDMPLQNIKTWSENVKFQIDALGLITLLGADEVNLSLGALHSRQYTEHLPLLATFVVAGNRFIAEQPGFVIYNLTDGITSTELKGWFTRWLMSQKINNATSVFEWTPRGEHHRSASWIAPAISFLLITPLLVCTLLMGDWYGIGNSLAIITSVFARSLLVSQLRDARDKSASPPQPKEKDAEGSPKVLCVVRSDGRMVTVKAPASVLETFTKDCGVEHPKNYNWVRRIAWAALGVHMCILGMCTLFTQIYTVVLLVLSTWAFCSNRESDLQHQMVSSQGEGDFAQTTVRMPFSKDWDVLKTDRPRKRKKNDSDSNGMPWDRRQVAWAYLHPDESADSPMKRWNLFPHESNAQWWGSYQSVKKDLQPPSNSCDEKLDASAEAGDIRPTVSRTTSTVPLANPSHPEKLHEALDTTASSRTLSPDSKGSPSLGSASPLSIA